MTTALVMAAVVMAVGGDNKAFIGMGCIIPLLRQMLVARLVLLETSQH